jgi:tetraacyldisaccharide 4'-kinase
VLLDDAYQNFDVKPSLNIILLDARFPFENGHCLPAGRLRELDRSRADVIVITHADAVGSDALVSLRQLLTCKVPGALVLAGKHGARGLWENNRDLMSNAALGDKRLFVAAGVGSFDGVVQTVRSCGVSITGTHAFDDHFDYAPNDITNLCLLATQQQCIGIVVTEKDWVKINPLLQKDVALHGQVSWYVIRVGFEFLSVQEYDCLIKAIRRVI